MSYKGCSLFFGAAELKLPGENNYSPFTDPKTREPIFFYDITAEILYQLQEKNIDEGFYVEYKKNWEDAKKHIPKIITSFANSKGGWLFIGIEDSTKKFLGVNQEDYGVLISDKLKESCHPFPRFRWKFVSLHQDSGIVVIWIPEGFNPPYIANGQIYQRLVGSSNPHKYNQILDRYSLDQLYRKSEIYQEKIQKFCKKDIFFFNDFFDQYNKSSSGYDPRVNGLCSFYLIPEIQIDFRKKYSEVQLATKILNESKKSRNFIYNFENEEKFSIGGNAPFFKYSFTPHSIIFRNNGSFEQQDHTIIFEFFYDGKAKIHIPFLDLDRKETISTILKTSEYEYNEEFLRNFRYINGESLSSSIMFLINFYHTLIQENTHDECRTMIIPHLRNVQKTVAFFPNSLEFIKFIKSEHLVICEKADLDIYKRNIFEDFRIDNLLEIMGIIILTLSAFGYSAGDSMKFLFSYFEWVANNDKNYNGT